ncbi:patatin-domain-containing protein [Conidiobolus coronatus NRRL 28638]|uniref:Lysophospholipase NTE1 n=1 Tax=Conidiobolus coronatus (strain ATCC 28846 / CBS 209.66 / NRRL 28638) TaxID=796925 RepID=A0A137PCI3_CONC2|nr:patatin-domain-containing protein [Conidiobolus coronatus NRRL 28638]|eukprot:KXN72706.1 patatin-domain-containing protein [Conidiobolus coronatus NRRL 28638]
MPYNEISVHYGTIFNTFIVSSILGFFLIRYKFLTNYSKLPKPEPIEAPSEGFDLQPDTVFEDETDIRPEFKTYPNDFFRSFLKSIKIFGYLEEPVLNELTRYLNTQRLVAGDILFQENGSDSKKSFYIVLDGCVQIYPSKQAPSFNGSFDDEYGSENSPMTEIKSGGSLSSLFTLMSLFTENVTLKRSLSTPRFEEFLDQLNLSNYIITEEASDIPIQSQELIKMKSSASFSDALHPNITARASVDTTLAVIPAEAFHRVTKKFPSAAAHIVQVILARFQRVTFLTLNNYLGMSRELLSVEKNVTDWANFGQNQIHFDTNNLTGTVLELLETAKSQSKKVRPSGDPFISQSVSKHRPLNSSGTQSKHSSWFRLSAEWYQSKSERELIQTIKSFVYGSITTCIGADGHEADNRKVQSADSTPVTFHLSLDNDHLRPRSEIDDQDTDSLSSYHHSEIYDYHHDISDEVELYYVKTGTHLAKQGDRVKGLYFVISGMIEVYNDNHSKSTTFTGDDSPNPTKKSKSLFRVGPGEIAGYLSALTGSPSFVNMKAQSDCVLGFLPIPTIERIKEKHPKVLLTLAKRMIYQLPNAILLVDFALEWILANSGQVLCRQYSFTLHAIRDSEVARIPTTLFNTLATSYPSITIQISKLIASRVKAQHTQLIQNPNPSPIHHRTYGRNNSNLKTVSILPVQSGVPIGDFASLLHDSFSGIDQSCTLINNASIISALGKHAFAKLGKLKLINYLAEQEDAYETVLFVADQSPTSPWTQWCIRQADCILLVGMADDIPSIGDFEKLIVGKRTTARKELVLLHTKRNFASGLTQKWLKNRIWIHNHHHIFYPYKTGNVRPTTMRRKNTFMNLKDSLEKYYHQINSQIPVPNSYIGNRSDFARLARRLCGKSIGIVLGGGGARGIGHIGFLQAMQEASIPVDIVGGCSIGAFVGALYARDPDTVAAMVHARSFSSRMANIWRKIVDLTYPVVSWFSGHEFNRGIWKTFNDIHIEDLWLPFYCVTTNITKSRLEVHQNGYAWRYIRASMSLSGFIPPLCDNGQMATM